MADHRRGRTLLLPDRLVNWHGSHMKTAGTPLRRTINWYVGFLSLVIPFRRFSLILDGLRPLLDNPHVTKGRSRCDVPIGCVS